MRLGPTDILVIEGIHCLNEKKMCIRDRSVDFSIGKGFFVEPSGDFELTPELLNQVKAKMREYVCLLYTSI